jgi:hypothetical protein
MEVYVQSPCMTQSFEEIQKGANQLISELVAHESAQEEVEAPKIPSKR